MKKLLKIFGIMLILAFALTSSVFAKDREIKSVAVTGIEAPYSINKTLDTNGEVPRGSGYRITDIAWQTPSVSQSGYYEVTIRLKTDIGYIFSGDISGTVNGESIVGKRIIDEEEMTITYAFNENSESSSTIKDATSTVRYRISVYCDTEEGTITPKIVRVLKGKSQTFTITPKEGYIIKDVEVDGESVGAVGEYTFKKVKENHIIKAYFEKAPEKVEMKPLLKLLVDLVNSLI